VTETFAIVPAQGRAALIIAVLVGLLLVGVMAMLIQSVRGGQASRFEVSESGLRLRGDLWGRQVPASAIKGDGVRLVDLSAAPELAPKWRTMGAAVPGYSSGWFKLRNGERALLYLTARTQAVYVPTTQGYSLLLSPQDPERFVARLKEVAGAR
jgi:hypothetical protein